MTEPAAPQRDLPLVLPHLLAGRYELRELVGAGGMGDVYRGVDVLLHREVAVKILRPDPEAGASSVARFHAEACALAAVTSPFVVTIFDFGFAEEGVYTVLRHVRGRPLDELLAERGALPLAHAVRLTGHVLSGLAELHSRGLVHGDVKPGNVIVDRRERAVLIDLGVAADLRAGRGVGGGTPPYMAPETGRAGLDHRADLFAAGIFLVEVLSGAAVVDLADCEHRAGALPVPLGSIVRVATDADPERRFRDARAMRHALRLAVAHLRDAGVDPDATFALPGRRLLPGAVTARTRASKPRD